ncbi:MAG: hypothetical protein ACLFVE_08335 [Chitinispirillaceae bacterium]
MRYNMLNTVSHNPRIQAERNKTVYRATVSGRLESKGAYLLSMDKGEVEIKLAQGSLKVGQKVLVSPSKGQILIAKSQTPDSEQPADSFISTEQKNKLAALVSEGKQVQIAPNKSYPDGVYKFSSAKELNQFLGTGNENLRSEKGTKTLLLATSGGTQKAALIDQKDLSSALQTVHGNFKSATLKSLPPAFLDRILSERSELNLNALDRIDSVLAQSKTSQASLSHIQTEKLAQWFHLVLDNPNLAQSLADRIPLSGAERIPIEMIQMRSSGGETLLPPPEQFFLYNEIIEGCEDKTALLMRLLSQAGLSSKDTLSSGLKQVLNDLLQKMPIPISSISPETDFKPLLQQLKNLSPTELESIYGNKPVLPEILNAEIVSSGSPNSLFSSDMPKKELFSTLNELETSIHKALNQRQLSDETRQEIKNLVQQLSATSGKLSDALSGLEKIVQNMFENTLVNKSRKAEVMSIIQKPIMALSDISSQTSVEPQILSRNTYQKLLSIAAPFHEANQNIFNEITTKVIDHFSKVLSSISAPEGDTDQLLQTGHRVSLSIQKIRISLQEALTRMDFSARFQPATESVNASPAANSQTIDNLRSELLIHITKSLNETFSSIQNLEKTLQQLPSGFPKLDEFISHIAQVSRHAQENGNRVADRLKNMLLELSKLMVEEGKGGLQDAEKNMGKERVSITPNSFESMKQSAQNLLNRLESLQLLSNSVQNRSGDNQVISLPMKIGQEWTEMQIKFVKGKKGGNKKGENRNISVYLNTSPSSLGDVSVNLDYRPPSTLKLSFQFEKAQVKSWFREQSEQIRAAIEEIGLTPAGLEFHMKRPKTEKSSTKESVQIKQSAENVEQNVDLKI